MTRWLEMFVAFMDESQRNRFYEQASREARAEAASAELVEDREALMRRAVEFEAARWDY